MKKLPNNAIRCQPLRRVSAVSSTWLGLGLGLGLGFGFGLGLGLGLAARG